MLATVVNSDSQVGNGSTSPERPKISRMRAFLEAAQKEGAEKEEGIER